MYKIQKEISNLSGVLALLDWDEKTYMPKKGIESRAEQEALIESEIHKRITDKKLYEEVKEKAKEEGRDGIVARRLLKDIEKEMKLPLEFVEKLAKLTGKASQKWQEAKEKKDFNIFKPYLDEIVKMKREEAKLRGFPHAYDSLIDQFEEGMTVEKLEKTFNYLKPRISDLVKRIVNAKQPKTVNFELSVEKQKEITKEIRKMMQLTDDKNRIDETEHPFTTTIGFNDVRITTNYNKNPLSSFFSTVHEGGHALYELGMPEEYKDTVIHDAPSFGLHESQSRFWENMIARNRIFWENNFELFRQRSEELRNVDLDTWFATVNQVKQSPIRIEADEVTYTLHIILRFEIEKALIEGSLSVDELPKVWNQKMKELLGIVPKNDAEGVLQDVHWSGGSFGYFPSYALGSIYASQIYFQMEKEGLLKSFKRNDFKPIIDWLKEKIHSKGRLYSAEEIIEQCCGEGLNPEKYFKYLEEKYSRIYNI